MPPTVSVVITSYNYGRYIGAAIESVLSQDFRDFELIISDNASTDDSIAVISRYLGDERVRLIRRPTNIGPIANYQAALEETKGSYVAFLSADDFFLAGHLRTMVRYYEDHPDVDVAWSGYVLAMPDGSIRDAFFSAFSEARDRNDFASLLSYDMYPCYLTMLFKRELLDEFAFSDGTFVAGDLDHVVRLAAAGKRFACVGNATVAWRQHGDNMSGGKYVRNGEQIEDQLRLLELYAVERHARKIIGYGTGILRMLEQKHMMFVQANPELAAEREADIVRRKAAISERVRRFATAPVPAGPEGPLVSIVVPTIGNIPYLGSALQSIAAQTYANWEIVLVSDGGPNLEHFVGSLPCAGRVTYVRRTNREGPAAARNTAFDFLHGGIVAYLDEDNLWDPRHLEVVVAALSTGPLAVRTEASLTVEQMDHPPGGRRDLIRSRRPFAAASESPDPYLSHAVPLNAVAHDIRCYQQCGLFDKEYAVLEDWEFFVRLQAHFAVFSVPECTVDIRVRPALEGQYLGANWGAFPAAIEKLYNAHLNSPTGTAGEARLALFQSVRDVATRALRAPEELEALEAMFVALGGMRREAVMIS
jgi:O-antigen biosynthesis protein